MAKKKNNPASPKRDSKSANFIKLSFSRTIILIVIILLAIFFLMNNCTKENSPAVEYYTFEKEGELTFTDSLGNNKIKIDIEIADNEYERQLGLMNRKSMEETQGMLFKFNNERPQSFWMRNTLISLDMMFINQNKEIVTIHKNTEILSPRSYPSTEPSMYVVEVIGGFTNKYEIATGDKIFWIETGL
ncbi:MAG: DUF192 domain-containing protein [Ignavibacteria bacterium]|jgi:uncharacterized membrane protein (UPF0127 family)